MTGNVNEPESTPHALLEFPETSGEHGATCALLTPAIKAKMRELSSGQVLEVRVADPTAKGDILSWSQLSGHTLVGMFDDDPQRLRFYLRKK